ncbi:MAG: M23 family metallopeptidase [Treponema sp.]|nr:M23 family metallopeptidase [Treponema sp.]
MNDFVNSLLDKQHIRKRKTSRNLPVRGQQARGANISLKPAFRPKGIIDLFQQNSNFIEKIKQEPAKVHRRSPPPCQWGDAPSRESPPKRRMSAPAAKLAARLMPGSAPRPRREGSWASFAVSAASITAIFFVILGGIFIIHSQDGSMAWTGRDVIGISGDSSSQHSLARYAGIHTWDPLAGQNAEQGSEQEPAQAAATAASGAMIGGETLAAIPLDLMETFAWQSYRVRRGDSVSTIAAAFSVSMDAIIASNGITNARALREGETLRIPNMDGIPHTVRSGDSLSGISSSFGVPLEAILDANDIQSDVIYAGMTLFIPGARMNRDELRLALGDRLFVHPVRGARLSSPFGWRNDPFTGVRRHHAAVDLAAPLGTPIIAAKDGRVSALGYDRVFGHFVILTHAGGFQTLYAHLHNVSVRRGDQVRQGARIGSVGNTGLSTGPHLHFAIYRNNRAVNPLDFLNPRS